MLKKTILCGALALTAISSFVVHAESAATDMTQNIPSDTTITKKIKALYLASPIIKTLNISVMTMNQNVVLTGTVDTDKQYETAVALAESVDNVVDVNADKLMISVSQAPIADTYITAKAEGTIMKEKLFGSKPVEYWPVSFETKNGVVYLSGTVDTNEQRANIIKLIESIHGVTSVKSSLNVK